MLGGLGHRSPAFGDELEAVLVGEGAGRDEGGVLPEAVAGTGRGLEADPFRRVEDDEARDEGGKLRVGGVRQRLLVGLEQQLRDVAPDDLARVLDELERRVVDPARTHARAL